MEFKDKLPMIRKERGLSQEGLAEMKRSSANLLRYTNASFMAVN